MRFETHRLTTSSRLRLLLTAAFALVLSATQQASAQTRAEYDFAGGSAASIDADATTTAADVVIGAFTNGSTNPGFSSGNGNLFARSNATGVDGTTGDDLSEAIANGAFASFTFDPLAAAPTLSTLSYDYFIQGASAASDYGISVLTSLDSFTAPIDNFTFSGVGGTTPVQSQLVDLTALTGFSSVASPIEFRFYFTDTADSNSQIHRLDNILLTSDVVVVPPAWNVDADGTWSTGSNWTTDPDVPGVGSLANSDVTFGSVITADRTVTLDTSPSLNRITFSDNNSYTIVDDPGNPGVNSITLTGDAEVEVTSADANISAAIAGTAGLVKTGSGQLFLSGTNSYTGTTDIQGGRIRLQNIASINDTVNVGASADFIFQGDDAGGGPSGTFTPNITGSGDVILSDTMTTEVITFDAAKSQTGLTQVNGGTLVVTDAGALGTATGTGVSAADRTLIRSNEDAELQIAGGITIAGEVMDLNARTVGTASSHIRSTSGNNTLTGEIVLDSAAGGGGTGGGDYVITSDADLLTLSGNIIDQSDNGQANLIVGGAGNGRIEGNFVDLDATPADGINDNDNISLTKRGTGTWTLAATAPFDSFNTYGGNTTVEEGTLVIQSVATPTADSGEVRSPIVTVNSGATLDVSSFGVYSAQIGQSLQGAGTIDATGGAVRVTGASSVKPGDSGVGTLAITGGLNLDDLLDTDPQAVTDRGLHFELSDVTTAGSGINDLITVSGNLDVNGVDGDVIVNIVPVGDGLASGDYTLIDYGTVSFQNSGAFTPQLVDSDGNPFPVIRQSLAVVDDVANSAIELQVSGSVGNLVWKGTVNNVWDVGDNNVGVGLGTANWDNSSVQDEFVTLDAVTFDDTATEFTVDVIENVLPSSTTFSNATNAYTLTGVGGIQGGSLTVNGAAGVTLDNDGNSFSSVSIGSGATLTLGDGVGNTDTINIFVDITNNGALVLNEETGGETLAGVISGSGTVTAQSGTLQLEGANTYTGETTVNGTVLLVNTDTATPLGDVSGATTVNAGGVVRGNGQTGNVAENVTLNGGELAAGGGTASAMTWSGDITIGAAAGASVQLDGGTDTFDGGVRQTNGLTITGNVSGSNGQDLELTQGGGSTLVVSGVIGHDGGITKNGGGTAELTAANTYTGDTNITSGTFALVDGGSIASSPNINVTDGGNFDVSGTTTTYALASGQTLSVGPAFSSDVGGANVVAGGFDDEIAADSGSVTGPITAGSGSTIDGLGSFSGNVTAESGSTVRVGTNGISGGFSGTAATEDFEGFTPAVVLDPVGGDTGALTGWTLIDVQGNVGPSFPATDVTLGISGADGSAANEITEGPAGHSQLLAVTSTNYDRLQGTDGANIAGAFAIAPTSFDTSNTVDVIEADLIFDGSGDGSGSFLDAKLILDFVDENNHIQLALVKGNAGSGGSTEVDVKIVSNGATTTVFDTFSDLDFSAGFNEDSLIRAKVVHDVATGFLSFELSESGTVLAEGYAVSEALKTAGTGRVGFGSNNDAFAVDNLSVTTQAGVNVEGVQIMNIDGDFTLDAGATLEIDLASTDTYDRLAITGALTGNGTLDVNLSGGFAPLLGDTFDIFDFGSALGTLAFDLPDLSGAGLDWDTTGLLVDGILEVVAASANLVGDFNGDGMVDSGDYAFWRNNLGVGAELAGTGDGSGILDAADLAFWVGNFGATSPGAAGAAAVPEPSALVLLGLSAFGFAARRRR